MELILKDILLVALILLVGALVFAVVQIILMLLDLRWISQTVKTRVKTVADIYDAVSVLGSASWKTFIKRFQKVLKKYFKNHFGGDDDEKAN